MQTLLVSDIHDTNKILNVFQSFLHHFVRFYLVHLLHFWSNIRINTLFHCGVKEYFWPTNVGLIIFKKFDKLNLSLSVQLGKAFDLDKLGCARVKLQVKLTIVDIMNDLPWKSYFPLGYCWWPFYCWWVIILGMVFGPYLWMVGDHHGDGVWPSWE